jgi:hypothetical protein
MRIRTCGSFVLLGLVFVGAFGEVFVELQHTLLMVGRGLVTGVSLLESDSCQVVCGSARSPQWQTLGPMCQRSTDLPI